MASTIDYNAIAASVYSTILNMNSMATSLVGLDCIWCRLLPYDNGEDVVIQEYTLHKYECPQSLRVVTSNSNYQIGTYMVDLWGVHSEVPLEITIDISTWKAIYGENTMPQKGDFVLFSLLHKAFEVKSSSIEYTIAEQPTAYKCQLGVWQHNANRQETEEFTSSIDEITDSQDRLFGDEISKEVADTVIEPETAYNITTHVDPIKEFDSNSIVLYDMLGENGTVFGHAYYDFNNAAQNVVYSVAAKYDRDVDENHWIFSCWFKSGDNDEVQSGKVTLSGPSVKEKDWWWFEINSGIKIEEGDEVTIYRGSVIKLSGVIEIDECDNKFLIKISSSDCFKASSKVQQWWKSGNWKIQKYSSFNLLTGYNGDDTTYKISLDYNNLTLKINDTSKKVVLSSSKGLSYDNWHFLTIDMSPSLFRTVLIRQTINNNKYSKDIIVDKTVKFKINNFEFDKLLLENMNSNICMCNIRLYENEYALDDKYLIDMYANIPRNTDKCILVDGPLPNNNMEFVTPLK